MPRPKLTLTLAVAAYAIGTYTFGEKDSPTPPPPPCDSYLASILAAAARAIDNDPPPRDSYLTSTLAAVVHAIGKYAFGRKDPPLPPHSCYLAPARAIARYFFDGKEPPPPRHPDLAPTLAAALACTGAVVVYAIVKYFFSGKDNNPPRRDPDYSSSSYISSTTPTQTQKSYRLPPPPPSYTYQPPATNAYSQTAARTPTIPDYDCSVHRPSVVSPYTRIPRQSPQPSFNAHPNVPLTPTPNDYGRGACQPTVALPNNRTPSQTRPSSTRIHASRLSSSLFDTDHVDEPPEYEYFPTSSHAPPRVPTGSKPPPPTAPVVVVSSGPCTDGPVGIEDLEFAQKLREQARCKGREMSEARSRAKSASEKGRLGAAHAHRQDAIAYESEMKELHKRAAKIVFRENNKNRGEGMIDLHGLHVAEAIQASKDQLHTARSRGDQAVRFIVGKGLHSDTGGSKIRPALEDFLTKRGLTHSLDPYNAGVLVVRLD
ncbi:hypothetical protein EDB83DRAFT_28082 [Lactarius deliciosus]|nr:hypothetical protein EDB83DRAFT_28082 [Lactarius deliciosus]